MIIGREALVELEALADLQTVIYNDACDYGFRIETKEDEMAMRKVISMFAKDFVIKLNNGSSYSEMSLFMPVENNEYDPSKLDGYKVIITKCWDMVRKITFYSIDISRASMPASGKYWK